VQSEQTQVAHESLHDPHSHTLWLHEGQVQFVQSHRAQVSEQSAHSHVVHSS
jgi:hypothetical protein